MHTRQFALRFAGGVLLAFLMMLPHSGARATSLALGVVGPGNDPLLDANPWFVFPDQSATTRITLSSNDTSVRTVRVTAVCCLDTRASRNVALAGLDVALTAPPGSVVKDDHPQVTSTGQERVASSMARWFVLLRTARPPSWRRRPAAAASP